MPALRNELGDCEIGDIALETDVHTLPGCERIFAHGVWAPLRWNETLDILELPPSLEFVRALATLPDSTAKVRVWKRVA